MNALVKKEIRLLLPAWAGALVLASLPVCLAFLPAQMLRTLGKDALATMTGFFFLLGILLLGVAPFGQEFSFKTSGLLLSQPSSRNRIWLVKISTLAMAFASILLAASLSWMIFYFRHSAQAPDLVSESKIAFAGAAIFFSGGLWTTLLFRQVTAAFWFTFLVPGAMVISIGNLSDHYQWSHKISMIVLYTVFGLYSIGGFFWARRLFFCAQDVQWTGGNIFFPWRKRFSDHTSVIVPGGLRGRYVALTWKEIQLHEASLFIAAILFVLHLATLPLRLITSNPDLKFVLETCWSLWLLMPLLIGSAAVAEERRTGTLESQLCQPVSRSAQFSIKFFAGLILSVILGALLPSLIAQTRNFGMKDSFDFWIFLAAPCIFFVSFYASTLARSTLQAIGMAIGIPLVVWAVLVSFALLFFQSNNRFEYENVGWVVLAAIIGVPSLLLVMARLMFWNFKWLHRDWKMWGRNAAVIAGFFVVIFILANAIFFRTWEFLTPADYPHGPVRLSDSKPIQFSSSGGSISAVLPDGRLWVETLGFNIAFFGTWGTVAPDRCKAQFIGGSNWTDVASGWRESLAIQSDGSLWGARQGWQTPDYTQSAFTRIGSETNWLHVAGGRGNGFLLLKTDGSLWIWGTNSAKNYYQRQMLDFKTPPARLGSETNWTALFTKENDAFAKKSDGGIWNWQPAGNGAYDIDRFVQNTDTDISWRGINNNRLAGIGTNGELWIASSRWDGKSKYVPQTRFQLGEGMKWKAVSFNYGEDGIIALRSDGTLWKWSALWQLDLHPEKIRATQLGNHSDWTALPNSWWRIALAADGSLWLWDMRDYIWLAPSRKPVYLGNIFTDKH